MYNNKRNVHTSWSTDDGIYLISGYPSGRTSDIIKTDGTTQEGFKLRVDSRYVDEIYICRKKSICYSLYPYPLENKKSFFYAQLGLPVAFLRMMMTP